MYFKVVIIIMKIITMYLQSGDNAWGFQVLIIHRGWHINDKEQMAHLHKIKRTFLCSKRSTCFLHYKHFKWYTVYNDTLWHTSLRKLAISGHIHFSWCNKDICINTDIHLEALLYIHIYLTIRMVQWLNITPNYLKWKVSDYLYQGSGEHCYCCF